MFTVPCRSCGARIGFIEMPSGKKMPVDPELVKTFGVEAPSARGVHGAGLLTLVTERGEVLTRREVSLTHPNAEPVEGYRPHWAVCSASERFRNKP